jgi:hypothetical protein
MPHQRSVTGHDTWVETAGEVELIAGWADVALEYEFAAVADTSRYQVFLTSYDAVLVFVQNRTPKGFEIHALSTQSHKLPRSTCCAYRVLARRVGRRELANDA